MTIVVLLILAALWAAVLVPPLLKGRVGSRSGSSISDFAHRIAAIGKTGGWGRPRPLPLAAIVPAVAPMGGPRPMSAGASRMTAAQRRRRDVLLGLGVAAIGTLLLALVSGLIALWLLHLLVDGALAGYVALLRRMVVNRHAAGAFRAPMTPHATPVVPLGNVRYLPKPVERRVELRRTASR